MFPTSIMMNSKIWPTDISLNVNTPVCGTSIYVRLGQISNNVPRKIPVGIFE